MKELHIIYEKWHGFSQIQMFNFPFPTVTSHLKVATLYNCLNSEKPGFQKEKKEPCIYFYISSHQKGQGNKYPMGFAHKQRPNVSTWESGNLRTYHIKGPPFFQDGGKANEANQQAACFLKITELLVTIVE